MAWDTPVPLATMVTAAVGQRVAAAAMVAAVVMAMAMAVAAVLVRRLLQCLSYQLSL